MIHQKYLTCMVLCCIKAMGADAAITRVSLGTISNGTDAMMTVSRLFLITIAKKRNELNRVT